MSKYCGKHFDYLNEFADEYNIKKIYLDNYRHSVSETRNKLNNAINDTNYLAMVIIPFVRRKNRRNSIYN